MSQYLYPSQRVKVIKEHELSPGRKKEIDTAIANCVIEDARPFGDFKKSGMLKLLNLLVPGYNPQKRETVTKRLSKRYKRFRKNLTKFLKQINNSC